MAAPPTYAVSLSPAGQAEKRCCVSSVNPTSCSSPTRTGGSRCWPSCATSNLPRAQGAVLAGGWQFLTQPASFFSDGDRPLRAADFDDPFRQGLFSIATATRRTEMRWLRETIADHEASCEG